MTEPTLLIVTGPPAAGKTTLARRLAIDLSLPLFSKDAIKESLFDTLGTGDRAWSMKLGVASIELLFHTLAWQLGAGNSVIAETAFIPEYDNARFLDLQRMHPCSLMQIYVTASPAILAKRFKDRANSGDRHSGHVDTRLDENEYLVSLRAGKYAKLDLNTSIIQMDTTEAGMVDYSRLLEVARGCLATPKLT
ncbi:MAG: ATP-binding protein [Caldilineaceae bacterium]|nr:ATP-binding protein [Caldilineaceae bacterium]